MAPFNRLLFVMTRPWVMMTYFLLLVILFQYVDKPLAEFLNSLNLGENFVFLDIFTNLGLIGIYIVIFLLCALFFRFICVNPIWEARMWFLWLCVITSGVICTILKVFFSRARPSLWFDDKYYGFYWLKIKATFWSFPSGHTSTIMAVAFGLCVLFPRYFYAFIAAGFLIAVSRILLVCHYLSDILMATYLALLAVGLLLWLLRKKSYLEPIWRDEIYAN